MIMLINQTAIASTNDVWCTQWTVVCLPALTNTRFKNKSMTVQILFLKYVIWNESWIRYYTQVISDGLVFQGYFMFSRIIILYVKHVSYRMYTCTLHIT